MAAKDVKFGRDARERIIRGVDILADELPRGSLRQNRMACICQGA